MSTIYMNRYIEDFLHLIQKSNVPCRDNRLFRIQWPGYDEVKKKRTNKTPERRNVFFLIYSIRDSLTTTIKIEFFSHLVFVEVSHCQYSCNYIFIVRGY